MKLHIVLTGLFLSLLFPNLSSAQTSSNHFDEGRLWLKVKPSLNLQLPLFYGKGEVEILKNKGFDELYQIGRKFGVYELQKAVKTQGGELGHIYQIRFDSETMVDELLQDILIVI